MTNQTLFDARPTMEQRLKNATFDGETAEPQEYARLCRQGQRVWDCMRDGLPWTLERLQRAINGRHGVRVSEASISARIRDFRKERFGSHAVERMNRGGGLFTYRLIVNSATTAHEVDKSADNIDNNTAD